MWERLQLLHRIRLSEAKGMVQVQPTSHVLPAIVTSYESGTGGIKVVMVALPPSVRLSVIPSHNVHLHAEMSASGVQIEPDFMITAWMSLVGRPLSPADLPRLESWARGRVRAPHGKRTRR